MAMIPPKDTIKTDEKARGWAGLGLGVCDFDACLPACSTFFSLLDACVRVARVLTVDMLVRGVLFVTGRARKMGIIAPTHPTKTSSQTPLID